MFEVAQSTVSICRKGRGRGLFADLDPLHADP
jgi:hypothetical protein